MAVSNNRYSHVFLIKEVIYLKKVWNFLTKSIGTCVLISILLLIFYMISDNIMKKMYIKTNKNYEDEEDDFDLDDNFDE